MLLSTSSSSSMRSPSSAFSIFPDLPSRMHSAPPPVPSSPPPSSKTHAFFTSSFAAASPPPPPPPPAKKRDSSDSTASTSSTTSTTDSSSEQPAVPSSTRSIFSSTSPGFHISRIFPSRYTSNTRDSSEALDVQSSFSVNRLRRKPEFLQLSSEPDAFADSIESTSGYSYNSFSNYGSTYHSREGLLGLTDGLVSLPTAPGYGYERDRAGPEGDAPLSPASSSASSSSSRISIRLPTPPPPPLLTPSRHNSDDNSEFTPRPSSYEPALSSFLRPVPEPISKAPSTVSTTSTAATEDDHDEAQEAGELHEGDIISSSSAAYPTSPSSTTFSSSSSGPSLQLVHSLGQGAFSAVWLAEDQSPVPLALTSKRSVRDLKRQASLQSKGGLSRNNSLKSNASRSGSVKGSGWSNVSRNSSFRKLKARLKGMKPVGVGKEVLNEHDSVSLDVVGGKTYVDELGLVRPLTPSSLTPEWLKVHNRESSSGSLDVNWVPPSLSRNNSAKHKSRTASTTSISSSPSSSRLVAVKLTPRRPVPYSPQAQERTRVGFVREVEILRHISHPNITPLFSFFSTPTYHVLVLPYLRGGDLLSLVNDDKAWNGLSEGVMRRIWCEICRGVGWMHSVGLVHRDVKLENVLITWEGVKGFLQQQESVEAQRDDEKISIAGVPLCCSPESVGSIHDHHQQRKAQRRKQGRLGVEDLPTPLIKLTDFGLSRFIDIGNGERGQGEMLSTRCGSEAYAAPELVMGSSSYSYSVPANSSSTQGQSTASSPPRKGVYDARETDAWACGVVLYALVARQLPFGEGVGADGVVGAGRASRIGGERAFAGIGGGKKAVAERRQWLMRIARGEWEWPPVPSDAKGEEGEELVGPNLVRCEGAKGVVSRLLVRDHRKRARIQDLWEDEWMKGDAVGRAVYEGWLGSKKEVTFEGELSLGSLGLGAGAEEDEGLVGLGEGDWEPLTGEEEIGDDEDDDDMDEIDEDEEDGEDEGWLLDEEGIASIARQEVV